MYIAQLKEMLPVLYFFPVFFPARTPVLVWRATQTDIAAHMLFTRTLMIGQSKIAGIGNLDCKMYRVFFFSCCTSFVKSHFVNSFLLEI